MTFATPERHAFGRRVLATVWPEVTGAPATPAELQIAGAQAHLESGYGMASYTNKLTGQNSGVINNWGAVQAGKPPCTPPNFEASDTHADGSPYNFCYRGYSTPEEGARDLVKQMTLRRPTSWAHMKRGDIDAWAQQMRTTDPQTGVGLYFEQSAEGRAHGIEIRIAEIAAALNEPIAAKRGGPMTSSSSTALSLPMPKLTGWQTPLITGGLIGLAIALWTYLTGRK